MASINELTLGAEQLVESDVDFDKIPEFGGAAPPPPQPGPYRFELPKAQSLSNIWSVVDTQQYGQRVQARFDQDAPLLIVQSPNGKENGNPFQTSLSNVPRPRGRDKVLVSDLALLLRALGEAHAPKTNREFIEALLKHAGQQFGGDLEWSWSCNPKRKIYIPDGQGGSVEDPEGRMGCGARFYQKDVQKVEGEYPLRISCGGSRTVQQGEEVVSVPCGAIVRAFANLTNFRK